MADAISTFTTIFLSIFINAIPFLLLGTLVSGLVEVFIDRNEVARLAPKHPLTGALAGGLLGLFIPVCACGVVPLVRRFLLKGAPLSIGISFLLAAPAINPITIAATLVAYGPGLVFWGRIGLTLVVALAAGALFSLQTDRQRLLLPEIVKPVSASFIPTEPLQEPLNDRSAPAQTWRQKTRRMMVIAGDEFFEMSRYLVIGSSVIALMQTLVPRSELFSIGYGPVMSVVALGLLAMIGSVYPTVDGFISLAFLGSFTSGSILAFLVYSSMIDIKSILLFSRVFSKRMILYLILAPLLVTVIIAILINIII